ncbi:MFS general substrate transporter [Rhizodiscina lignyota]|uniref:MFS general substrate transporter n=1 Tax=Rhizodiscina lignyota TaxID=1504668 RepID=A0A9P4MEB6_9PEZI|nr:MFS general substrate transporter [Rhizodiscina lignyota]
MAPHTDEDLRQVRSLDAEDVKGRDFTIDRNDMPKGYFFSPKFIGSMFAIGANLGSGTGAFALIAPILSFVNEDIGPDANLTWVAIAYLLASSIGFPFVGRLTDIFGRRWFFIFGGMLATVGSIVCATAPNINAMIAGEVILGLAASGQILYGAPISELVPMKHRFWAQGYVVCWTIPTSSLAAVVAYAFVFQTKVGWRGVFYFLIALNVAITIALFLFYRPPSFHMKHGDNRKTQYLKHFDFVGAFLFVAGLLLFIMGISWGGVLHPWKSAAVIAPIIIGFFLLVAFALWEGLAPLQEPLVPLHLFKVRGFVISVLMWSLGASVYYANAILWPSMVNTLYASGHGVMWGGWASCLANSGITLGELLVPVGTLFKNKHWQIRSVFFIGSAFVVSMASCTPHTPTQAMALIFFGSFFIGYNEIANSTVITLTVDDQREIGTANGIASSVRNCVSTICSTVFTTVLANRLAESIPAKVPPALTAAGLPASSVAPFITALSSGSATAFNTVQGLTPTIQAIGVRAYQEANSDAFRTVYLTTLAFSGIGMLLSIFYPNIDHLLTNAVSVQLHNKGADDHADVYDEEKKIEN